MARTIFSSVRAQAKHFWHCVVSYTALQSPSPSYTTSPSSFLSCPPSPTATTPSSSTEKETATVVGCPPHRLGRSSTCYLEIPENFLLSPRWADYGLCVASNTALQSPPPSYTSSSSSSSSSSTPFSLATTPSSSPEKEHHPSVPLTTVVVRPPHQQCPGKSPTRSPVPKNVDSSSSQSISDGDLAESSSPDATSCSPARTTQLHQADSTNQSYEYPPPFNQILVDPGLGKMLLGADLPALLAMTVLLDKNESIGLWGRVVCLLLLLSSLALFFALLLKELYPVFAMVTVLLGIGCSIAAICAYPLYVFLPHFWVTVLSTIVALSVMTPIMIIFCSKKYEREES